MFEMIPKILPYAVIPVCVGFFLMCGFISWKVYGKKATIWGLTAAPSSVCRTTTGSDGSSSASSPC